MPAEKDHGRSHAALLGNVLDDRQVNKRAARAAKGAVSGDMDPPPVAKFYDLLLRKQGVILDLVDSRNYADRRKELFEVLQAVVGDTYGPGLPRSEKSFHVFPGVDVGALAVKVATPISELGKFVVISYRNATLALLHVARRISRAAKQPG